MMKRINPVSEIGISLGVNVIDARIPETGLTF